MTLFIGEGKKVSKYVLLESSVVAQRVKNLTSIHEDAGKILCLSQWVKDPALMQGGRRLQTWLGSRVAVAMA